jgi:hypothetical protein
MLHEDVITHASLHHMAWSVFPSIENISVTTACGRISRNRSICRIYVNIFALFQACVKCRAHFQRLYICSLQGVVYFSLIRSPACLSVYKPLNASTCLSETWYVRVNHGIWAHLNGVIQRSLPSVCVSVCVSLLRKGSENVFPRQRIHATRA